jgi:hypothetical protein
MSGFFQVRVYFTNGSVLCSTPMLEPQATEFSVVFVKQLATGEVLSVQSEPISKEDAQAQFRADAAEWKKFAEHGRQGKHFNENSDRIAATFYQTFMRVGCSS